uniref:Uncharacterized protein n=1 Tax=Anguilla anguilla TaxID=7936 RepID=A0A0E9S4T8_ANGAN
MLIKSVTSRKKYVQFAQSLQITLETTCKDCQAHLRVSSVLFPC